MTPLTLNNRPSRHPYFVTYYHGTVLQTSHFNKIERRDDFKNQIKSDPRRRLVGFGRSNVEVA